MSNDSRFKPGKLTKEDADEIESKLHKVEKLIASDAQTIADQKRVIEEQRLIIAKQTAVIQSVRDELVSIKKQLLIKDAQSTPADFRRHLTRYLTELRADLVALHEAERTKDALSSDDKKQSDDDHYQYCYTDIGRSNLYIAAGRAIESQRAGRDRLFTDHYADHFAKSGNNAGYTFMSLFADALTEANSSKGIMGEVTVDYLSMFASFRTRWIDDSIYAALNVDKQRMRRGQTTGTIKQIVIIGVGCDTRCYRLSKLPKDCKLFHVDTAEAMRFRNQVLDGNDLGICPHFDVVMEKEWSDKEWIKQLKASGFDATKKNIWICEGVLEHLEGKELEALMGYIRDESVDGSWFIGEMPNVVNCGMKDMWDTWCDLGGKRAVSGVDLPKVDILDKYGFNAFQSVNILGTEQSNYYQRSPESYIKHQMSNKPVRGDKIARIQLFRGMMSSDTDSAQSDEKCDL